MRNAKDAFTGTLMTSYAVFSGFGVNQIDPPLVSGELEHLAKALVDAGTLHVSDAGTDLGEFIKDLAPAIEHAPGKTLGGLSLTASLIFSGYLFAKGLGKAVSGFRKS